MQTLKVFNLRKLWLSLLLLVGATAIAIPGIQEVAADGNVAKIGSTEYQTLQLAYEAAQDGDVITLLKDIDERKFATTANYNFTINKSITLDGDDHSIEVDSRGIAVNQGGTSLVNVTFKNLTVNNATKAGRAISTRGNIGKVVLDNVKINCTGGGNTQGFTVGGSQTTPQEIDIINGSEIHIGKAGYCIITFNPVSMNVEGSTLDGWASIYPKGMDGSAGSKGSVFNIKNSILISENVNSGNSNAFSLIKVEDDGVTINLLEGNTISISGTNNFQSIVATEAATNNQGQYTDHETKGQIENCVVNISGGDFTMSGSAPFSIVSGSDDTSLNISGGNFTLPENQEFTNQNGIVSISGGSFSANPSNYLAEGYKAVENNGTWTVEEIVYVAQIGTQKYETLAEAVAAANAGETIEVIVAGDYKLPNLPKNVTIEGAVDGVVFKDIVANPTNENNIASIPNGATFKNVTWELGKIIYHGFTHAGTINMEDCTINGGLCSYGNMNFTNCKFEYNGNEYCMWVYGPGEVVYDQCTFTNNTKGKLLHLYCEGTDSQHKVTVKDCKFVNGGEESKAAINVKATSGSNALQYELHLEGNNTYEGNFPTAVGEQANADKTWILSPLAQVDDRAVNPDKITVYKNDKLIYPVSYVAAIGEVKYTTLEDAFAAVQNSETVTLLDNLSLNDKLIVSLGDKAVTLDLGGNTLTGRTNLTSGSLTVKNGSVEQLDGDGQPLNVYGSATAGAENYSVLTVAEDVTVSGDYGVCMFGPTASAKAGYGAVVNIAGTLNGTKGTVFVSGNLGNNIDGDMNNVVNITGKVNGNNDAGVALNGNATVNVKSGAEITGNTGIAVKRGVLNVEEGATVHATGAENLNPDPNNNGTEMTGAAISMTDTYNNYGAMSVNITGGTFTSDNTVALFKEDGTYANDATYAVSGGTFSSAVPAEFCAEGYVPVKISDGKYSVAQGSYVAQIGEDKYVSLQSALDAAHEMTGDVTVELLDDISGYSIVHQKAGLNLTIDGKDKTVNGQIIIDGDGRAAGTETLTIQNIKFEDDLSNFYTGTDAFILVPSTKDANTPYTTGKYNYAHNITITDCSFNSTADAFKAVGFKSNSGAGCYNLVMSSVTGDNLHSLAQLTGTTGATFDNCSATLTGSFIGANGGGGTYTVSNCTFESHPDKADGYAYREKSSSTAVATLTNNNFKAHDAIILGSAGTINIESGTYVGEISKTAGTIVISGGKFSAPVGNSDYAQFIEEGKTGVNGLYPEEEQAKNGLGEAVATITDSEGNVTNYAKLESAFADAKDGDTVKPLVDITELASNITIGGTHGDSPRVTTAVNPVNVTFDLNGKTIKSDKTIYLVGGSLNITGEGTIETTGSGVAPVGVRYQKDTNYSDLDYTSKRTLTIGENVTLKGVDYGLNIFGTNEGTVANNIEVNINGKVEGTTFVLGNLSNTDNNIVVNVNSGASLKGKEGIALNGFATVNVADNTTIEGTELGIEVRAGNLNVAGGTITSTATEYTVKSNGDGSAAKGAAISVAQHTTGLPISTYITGCTLSGVKTISVADPENGNLAGVTVKVADALANAKTVIIPVAYEWVSDGTMSTLTPRDPVARIDDVNYYSLADAIAAVPANGTEATTITLLADVTENVVVSGGKNIVLDLGGKTATGGTRIDEGYLTVKNGTLAGTVNIYGSAAEVDSYNGITVDATATVGGSGWGIILREASGTKAAYGTTIDINGKVNGNVWVMGNIENGNSVINVNSGAKIEGSVFGLNGLATLNVKEGATIIGSETGIEVRAGNLNVEGGTITSTATAYTVTPNGSGTTTVGAAIAVAQHTTGLPINANITGGTLSGLKTISVADPQGLNYTGVVVTAKDELTEKENNVIPDGYIWMSNNNGTSTLTKIEDGEYVLIDKENYPFMNLKSDISVPIVTYKRIFGNTNWQALFIPFDINDVTELTDKYEFAKVHMVAYETKDGAVVSTKIRLYYIPITSGTIYANKPYLIKLKNKEDINKQQEIKVENTTLYHTQDINDKPMTCSTTNADYLFKGTYRTDEVKAVPNDPSTHFFGVGGGGISYINNNKLSSYRWYIKVNPKDINYAKPTIEFVMGDEDVTGISNINNDDKSEIEGYYTVNGIRSDVPVKGMNIMKYKNGKTKKVMIK